MDGDNDAPYAGFFGKLPVTGDFVARGLSPAFRARWDAWVTRYLTPRRGRDWPAEGLRFRLASGGRCASGLILPGGDSQGRAFPLSLVAVTPLAPGREAIDRWCAAALVPARAALAGNMGADDLAGALAALPPPEAEDPATGPMLVWTEAEALSCDPAAPDAALDALLPVSSGESSPP